MTRTFLSHIYKSFVRSPSVGKDIAIQVTLGFIFFLFAAYAFALGVALEKIIVNGLKQPNAVSFLNALLIYYFFGEFITRYFIQNLPGLAAQPYLHLPVSRSKIAHFLLGKSLINPLNLFIFLLFTPFALNAVANVYGTAQAWAWLLSLWLVSIVCHFLVILIKTISARQMWKMLVWVAVCAGVGYADYFGWLKLSRVSEIFFDAALHGYALLAALLVAAAFFYVVLYRALVNKLYVEETNVPDRQQFWQPDWTFLQKFGRLGAWISVELKLILRNKRPREIFLMHVVFLLLPLGYYAYTKNRDAYGSALFFALISSGFFTMNYGQFLFSWQASHFDFTLLQRNSIRQFVESKFWLMVSMSLIWFLFSIPYLFLGWDLLLVNLAASLYNAGINTFIVMNMSMWGAKKIDLKHSGSLNYEGLGAAQWIMGIPLLAGPYLFFLPFNAFGYPLLGLVAISLAGVVGILAQRGGVSITARRLSERRHQLASNFRD